MKIMKSERQQEIRKIINTYGIETQDEPISHLNKAGFDVTQATVSRDIREMKITKALGSDGRYTYMLPVEDSVSRHNAVYGDTIAKSLRSVNYACNTVVLKTYPGLAQAVASTVDGMKIADVLGLTLDELVREK